MDPTSEQFALTPCPCSDPAAVFNTSIPGPVSIECQGVVWGRWVGERGVGERGEEKGRGRIFSMEYKALLQTGGPRRVCFGAATFGRRYFIWSNMHQVGLVVD